ncbi:MAG: hypothetical protein Q8M16_14570 [Pirellulaceae bacterium]|nr:hypothetical protein [Pirellulaceae bacterium]
MTQHRTVSPRSAILWCLLAVCAGPLTIDLVATAKAAPTLATALQDDEQQKSELGQRQRAVLQRWAQLEAQFMSMAEKLKPTQPERADRLIVALNTAKQNLIARRMETVANLLDTGKLAEADKTLDEVIKELEALVRLLLNDQSNRMNKEEELEFLEQVKKDIKNLLQDQNQQTRETFKISNRNQVDKDLQATIKQIDELIERQQKLKDNVKESPTSPKAQDQAAEKQFQIRKNTLETAKDLDEKFQTTPPTDGQSRPGEQAPNEQKPGEQKPGEQKPGEQKPGEQKPGEQKPGEQKPGEQKPGEQKPTPPSGQSPSESKPSKSGDKPKDQSNTGKASEQLKQSAEKQQEAERMLAEGKKEEAEAAQEKALEDLKKARNLLEQERRRLNQLPEEAAQRQSPEQRRLADRTKELSDKIAKAKLPSKENQSNDPKAEQAQAGKPKVDEAQSEMQQAADKLDKNDADPANENQKKAEEKLEEALADIEERLNQLREETREERLARLEARFMELLLRQQDLRGRTEILDDKLVSLQTQNVRDRLILLELSTQQEELSELCQLAYDLLLEDGTSVVFPEIVAEVKTDMLQAAGLLKDKQTGGLVQLLHREIESTLDELLSALKQSKKKGGEGGGGGGGGGGEQPLVKRSAELKMLRGAQLRVNRKTRQLNEINEQDLLPNEQLNDELNRLSGRQTEIIEMTQRLMESIQAEGQGGPPPGGQQPPPDDK